MADGIVVFVCVGVGCFDARLKRESRLEAGASQRDVIEMMKHRAIVVGTDDDEWVQPGISMIY